jgi:hypothetical protein
MINLRNINKALHSLRPGATWSCTGGTYDGIDWLEPSEEKGGQSKPSEEEVVSEIERLQVEYEYNEYQRLRAPEYPPITDYLDGIVKNDQEQIQTYINACLAVKAKYPKPE